MGFFKDFKEDLAQAVNELLPEEDEKQDELDMDEQIVNTLDTEEVASDEVSDNEKMKEWLEEFIQEENTAEADSTDSVPEPGSIEIEENKQDELATQFTSQEIETEGEEDETMDDNVDLELLEALGAEEEEEVVEDKAKEIPKLRTASAANNDEVTIITKGTTITGSISSDGSLEINGTITGDVECLGKLSITGKIVGNSTAAEVYVNTERLEGGINSEGTVKIGLGTVVIGDIVATSGVIAGAVKGEIDVNGPIVIDSTAIIKGNIKAKSVQINNGAVVEGFCSLSYSAIDVDNVFE